MDFRHNPRFCMPFLILGTVVWSALFFNGLCDSAKVFSDEPVSTTGEDSDPELLDEDVFQTQTTLFLKKYCVKCHGAQTQEGDLRLDTVLHDLADDQTAKLWNDIFAQVQFSEMPP
ncbi:MAG: hypothetical protein NZ744_02170, partial [Pirellulaceae bacterium]|nr:hypothetical protein [Pirellulaceae bacterium]